MLQLEGLIDAKIGNFDPVTNTLQFVDLGLVRVGVVTRNYSARNFSQELHFLGSIYDKLLTLFDR